MNASSSASVQDPQPVVIVIDDDRLVALAQSIVLQDLGFEVIAGSSVSEIERSLGPIGHRVGAIIADFDLGQELNGFEVAQALARTIGRDVPIVIVSGSVGDRARMTALRHGTPFLMKPVDPARFNAVLRKVMGDFA